ncbi:unnamed protein product, partial [Prorocentrum cordatum]
VALLELKLDHMATGGPSPPPVAREAFHRGLELHASLDALLGTHSHCLGTALALAKPWLSRQAHIDAVHVKKEQDAAAHGAFSWLSNPGGPAQALPPIPTGVGAWHAAHLEAMLAAKVPPVPKYVVIEDTGSDTFSDDLGYSNVCFPVVSPGSSGGGQSSGASPGQSGVSPGQSGSVPGQSGVSPGSVRGQSGVKPGSVRGQSGVGPGPVSPESVRGQSRVSPGPVWGQSGVGLRVGPGSVQSGISPGSVRGQSGVSPGSVRGQSAGQSGASPGPVRGQSVVSPGSVRGQSGVSPGVQSRGIVVQRVRQAHLPVVLAALAREACPRDCESLYVINLVVCLVVVVVPHVCVQ